MYHTIFTRIYSDSHKISWVRIFARMDSQILAEFLALSSISWWLTLLTYEHQLACAINSRDRYFDICLPCQPKEIGFLSQF